MSKNIKRSERVLKQVIDSIPSRIFWKDRNFKYLDCNKSFAKYTENDIEDIIGKDDYEMGWSEYSDSYREDDKYVIETGQSKLNFEEKIRHSCGEIRWVNTDRKSVV